jgi:hypothetical protein
MSAFVLCAHAQAFGQSAPPATSPPELRIVDHGADGVSVAAASADVRDVLEALASRFAFPIVNVERLPGTLIEVRFDRVPVARVVDQLLRHAGASYVMAYRSDRLVPTRLLVSGVGPGIAVPGGSPRRASLATFELAGGEPPVPAAPPVDGDDEKARKMDEERAREAEKTLEEREAEVERTLREEGEQVPPRAPRMNREPPVVALPDAPRPTFLPTRPVERPLNIQPQIITIPAGARGENPLAAGITPPPKDPASRQQ